MLETMQHPPGMSMFVTLTYRDSDLPVGASLVPRHLQLFLKRFRKAHGGRIRFYAVGEYGDRNNRPHYHAILYGCVVSGHRQPAELNLRKDPSARCDCMLCNAWGLGVCHIGQVTPQSCQYAAMYVVKGLTKRTDGRLDGRHPEFARMSLRSGIGASSMEKFAATLFDRETGEIRLVQDDVITSWRTDGKQWPLGRYLRGKLRVALGLRSSEPELVALRRSYESMLKYPDWRARDHKEKVRKQHALNAEGLVRLSLSKKGVGL